MKTLILLIFILLSSSVYASEIPSGEYGLITESEWFVYITIFNDNEMEVVHSSWLPGNSESMTTNKYKGTLSCQGDQAEFKYELESIKGQFKKYSPYPLGIYKDSKAIVFPESTSEKSLLGGRVFWPKK